MDIVVKITNVDNLTDKNYRKYNELLALMHKRFGFQDNYIKLKLQPIDKKGLCASTQVENLKVKLLKSTPSRTASQAILRAAEMSGAKGCEVVISGKVRQQRAKTIKYKWGYLVSTGQPTLDHVDVAIRHVFFKQGILGVKVKIMRPVDPSGRFGCRTPLPDSVEISDPKEYDEPDVRKMQVTAPPPQQTPVGSQPVSTPAQ